MSVRSLEHPKPEEADAAHVVCLWPQGRSSLSTERAEGQLWLLVASQHKEIDQVEVTSSPGGGQLMQEGQGQGSGRPPVLGSSVGRVPKGQTSDSIVMAECSKPVRILSSWRLLSGLLHQKPDVVLLYLVNMKLNRNTKQLGKC